MNGETISKVLTGETDIAKMSHDDFVKMLKCLDRMYFSRVMNCVDGTGKFDKEWTALSCIFRRVVEAVTEKPSGNSAATATTEKSSVVGDCAKLSKTVDLRFDICRDIALVLKIGRDYQNKDGYRGAHYDTVKLLCDTIEYQQEQLETKTKVGNAAKLRETAVTVYDVLEKLRPFSLLLSDVGRKREFSHLVCLAKNRLDAALAAPQRNCDVGTAEEQSKRKMKFCYQQGGCSNCSFSKSATLTQCALAWAQMPYAAQEGGEG